MRIDPGRQINEGFERARKSPACGGEIAAMQE